MRVVCVPKPVVAQRTVQGEDGTHQLAAIVGRGRRQRAGGHGGVIVLVDDIVVEIVGVQGAHGEGRYTAGDHGSRDRGREEGVVRLDRQGGVLVRLGIALAGEITVVHLYGGLDRIGQL